MRKHPYADTPQFRQANPKPWTRDISDPREQGWDARRSGDKQHDSEMAGFVYLVQAGEDGPIKIGTAGNVEKRISHMQVANPAELTLLAKIPGSYVSESVLHQRFAEHRLRGEWFHPAPAILDYAADPPTEVPFYPLEDAA